MAFGTLDQSADADTEVMSEINMTPLVDVMLVLLIVFIVTIPILKQAVNVELPTATSQAQATKPETITLSVDAQGSYFWNKTQVSPDALGPMLSAEAGKTPQPELHIYGDKAARYEFVAQAMAGAQQAGLKKIGFVTEPQR